MLFKSRRSTVLSTKSMVASSQPLASAIGNSILLSGGNACDAGIAMAAALAVTEPCSTGVGGDMFALYYDAKKKKVFALNGSGRSAKHANFDYVKKQFPNNEFKIPRNHGLAVTVPGAVAGWIDALKQYGTKNIDEILTPAIKLAKEGFPVSEITSYWWNRYGKEQLEEGSCFLPPPLFGKIFKNPQLAFTFESIAKFGKEGFYCGQIAKSICESVKQRGGSLTEEDLANHESSFVEPMKITYRNKYDIYECPPNGQGLVALMALDSFQKFPSFSNEQRGSASHLHLMIECLRSSFADARKYIADDNYMKTNGLDLLNSKRYIQNRQSRINPKQATEYPESTPISSSDTVSFQAVDQWGNAISMVNSTYEGFGTGICVPNLGFSLQNRGSNFSLNENSANCVQGSKRPYHTIIPGMTLNSSDQSLHTSFTVMGGFMQPQGHFQILNNLIDWRDTVQEALDAPRFCILAGNKDSDNHIKIALEEGMDEKVGIELKEKFKQDVHIVKGFDRALFGRGQIILKDGNVLFGGSDPRSDGCAIPGI